MAGKGPAPKRSDQRRRRNKPAREVDKVDGAALVEAPSAKRGWHPAAKRWFESLAESGQAKFYEPSDWATAMVIAESMSRDLRPKVVAIDKVVDSSGSVTNKPVMASMPINGASLNAYLRAFGALMVTEADRRTAGIELQRPDPDEGEGKGSGVTKLDKYRKRAAAERKAGDSPSGRS